MKKVMAMQIAALITCVFLLLSGLWTGIFFLTMWLYHTIGNAPPPFLIQVINALLGLVLFILLTVGTFSWNHSRPEAKRKQRGIFEPIIEAMGRIAQGDFQVRLNPTSGANAFTSQLAESVNQMAADLNRMEHMRQEFISTVSHDIQSPLTSIHGFARALHNEQLSDEEKHRYLSIIEVESMRLSRMTDNMLRLASLDAEQVKIEPKRYRLDKQIRTLILACEPQWTGKAIDIEVALEEVEILADEDLLSQVWSNILQNSIKFTPDGGKVRVEATERNNQIECRVTDTGIGIPSEEQARIFERFYKVDPARKRAQEGNGLGLAISKKIVELHQGSIEVRSQPDCGTAMIVTLPTAVTLHSAE